MSAEHLHGYMAVALLYNPRPRNRDGTGEPKTTASSTVATTWFSSACAPVRPTTWSDVDCFPRCRQGRLPLPYPRQVDTQVCSAPGPGWVGRHRGSPLPAPGNLPARPPTGTLGQAL